MDRNNPTGQGSLNVGNGNTASGMNSASLGN